MVNSYGVPILGVNTVYVETILASPTKLGAHPAKTQNSRLISLYCLPDDALDPWLPIEYLAKTDQTAWMRRLTRDFTGFICGIVGNAVPRLI